MQAYMMASKAETADFERDPDAQLTIGELSKKKPDVEKEKRFLLGELKQIKDQMYTKLLVFKARTQGKRTNPQSNSVDNGQFQVSEQFSVEEILRKEIDHFFVMTQVLNTVVLKGDETYRTMQELAKLTNDQDQVSLDQLVKRL